MTSENNLPLIDYGKMMEYFIKDFPDSKVITSTTAESMKLILRKPVGNHIAWAQIGVEGDKLIVFEKIESLSLLSDELASALRKEMFRCLSTFSHDMMTASKGVSISKIVYFESLRLSYSITSSSSFEVVKMYEILEFIDMKIPESEIIDSGHGLRIRLGNGELNNEKKGIGQLVVKDDLIILTPNVSYFLMAKRQGIDTKKTISSILSLSKVLNEDSIFHFGKNFRLNWSFGKTYQSVV